MIPLIVVIDPSIKAALLIVGIPLDLLKHHRLSTSSITNLNEGSIQAVAMAQNWRVIESLNPFRLQNGTTLVTSWFRTHHPV